MFSSMMAAKRIVASALIWVLAAPLVPPVLARQAGNGRGDQADAAARLRDQVTHLPANAWIEVRLVNREKIHGRLGTVELDGFAVKPQAASAAERHIAFADVKSVKKIQGPRSRVAVWIVAGVMIGVVVVALALVLKERHNEGGF